MSELEQTLVIGKAAQKVGCVVQYFVITLPQPGHTILQQSIHICRIIGQDPADTVARLLKLLPIHLQLEQITIRQVAIAVRTDLME